MLTIGNKIRAVVVDDHPQSILTLQHDLEEMGDFEVVATSSSPSSASALVMSLLPDVLFIDVEMPGQTGFEVLESMRETMPEQLMVVFYSAFDKYMIEALRASAFDFLLKPYLPEELDVVVERIRHRKMKDVATDESDGLFPQELLPNTLAGVPKRTAIQTVSGLLMVKPEDVFCCAFEEETHLWCMKMTNGIVHKLKKQVTAKLLLSISPSFMQVRQDCIVNLDFLLGVENNSLRCIFAPPFDHEDIVISRRCYKAVKDSLEIL